MLRIVGFALLLSGIWSLAGSSLLAQTDPEMAWLGLSSCPDTALLSRQLDSLARSHEQKKSSAAFVNRALPIYRKAAADGCTTFAKSGLLDMRQRYTGLSPELRSDLHYELAEVFDLEENLDSVTHHAARAIAVLPDTSVRAFRAYWLLGKSALAREQWRQSQDYLQTALTQGLIDREQNLDPLLLIARSLDRLATARGRPELIIEALQRVLSGPSGPVDGEKLFYAYADLAYAYDALKQFPRAIVACKKAIHVQDSLTVDVAGAQVHLMVDLGYYHKKLAAYEDAVTYYRQARAYYLRWDPVPTAYVSYTYRNEAVARYKQGKFELATALHQKSRALNLADGDTLSLANDYTNLGTVAAKKEDWVTAGEHYATALRLRRQYPEEAIDLANDYINLADARLATGQTDRARLLADSARQLEATALPERDPQAAYTFLTQARIARAAGQVSTALSLTQRALIVNHASFADTARGSQPPLENYLDYERYFEALLLKGELLRKTTPGGSTAAHQPYKHAQQLLENVQNELTNREDQITLAGYVYQLADAAVANAHELYERTGDHRWAEAAFFFTEKSKANVLANAMSGNAARRSAGIPDTLLEKEDRLRAELGDYQRELAGDPDTLRRYELTNQIFRANEAYKELLTTYRRDYPRYFELKHSRAVPTITKLRAALRPGQALQTYFTGTRQLFVLTITAGKFSFSGIPLPRRFSRSVTGLNKGIHRRIDRVYLRQASKLGQLLLPHPLPEAQELILVPDGPLLKIPFEALLTEAVMPTEATDFTTLPYLLRKHQIIYAPSASLWYRGLTDKSRSEEPYSHELLAFAPVFATGKTTSDAVQSGANESLLAPLPATEGELQTLDSLFQDAGRNSTVFVGQTATKNNLLRSEVEKVRYLHLATHGYVNEATPDLSGLAFYPASTDSRNDFLSVGEVYDLHLQAELVSLSACETGIGKVATGEGVLGFSRAFLYAGADNLLVSLWQVQDGATAALMTDFYRKILQQPGTNYAAALRATKLGLLATQTYGHPYYWSPFILIGG